MRLGEITRRVNGERSKGPQELENLERKLKAAYLLRNTREPA